MGLVKLNNGNGGRSRGPQLEYYIVTRKCESTETRSGVQVLRAFMRAFIFGQMHMEGCTTQI